MGRHLRLLSASGGEGQQEMSDADRTVLEAAGKTLFEAILFGVEKGLPPRPLLFMLEGGHAEMVDTSGLPERMFGNTIRKTFREGADAVLHITVGMFAEGATAKDFKGDRLQQLVDEAKTVMLGILYVDPSDATVFRSALEDGKPGPITTEEKVKMHGAIAPAVPKHYN